MKIQGFVDSWTAVGYPEARGWTCTGGALIDYHFLTADLRHRIGDVWIDDTAQSSDHQPVWLDLNLDVD